MKKTIVSAMLLAAALPLSVFAADGAALFKTKCAPCHGPDGKGQTPVGKNLKVRDLTSAEVQKESDADLIKVIMDGKGKMPSSKLNAGDAKTVLTYIRGLKK
jgi:mono/diheme cytochrome c family protein